MKKLLLIATLLVAGYAGFEQFKPSEQFAAPAVQGDRVFADAFENRETNLQVQGEGVVTKILSDDREGGRHQRFIVRLESGQTLLIAHNIDLAPRISALREGDRVAFNGEYEWRPKGGVIHWTHHDPEGKHIAGWLKHNGKIHQ